MKYYVILISVMIMTSCGGGKTAKILTDLGMEGVQNRKFDIEKYEQNRGIFRPGSSIEGYTHIDEKGIKYEYIYQENKYFEWITYPENLIMDNYIYYKDGNIMAFYNHFSKGNFNIGKELLFDETGCVTEIIDHDAVYKFTLDQVLAFIEANGMDIWKDEIFVSKDSGMPWTEFENDRYWGIRHNFMENGVPMERGITLDGMTGKVLEDVTGPEYPH